MRKTLLFIILFISILSCFGINQVLKEISQINNYANEGVTNDGLGYWSCEGSMCKCYHRETGLHGVLNKEEAIKCFH